MYYTSGILDWKPSYFSVIKELFRFSQVQVFVFISDAFYRCGVSFISYFFHSLILFVNLSASLLSYGSSACLASRTTCFSYEGLDSMW